MQETLPYNPNTNPAYDGTDGHIIADLEKQFSPEPTTEAIGGAVEAPAPSLEFDEEAFSSYLADKSPDAHMENELAKKPEGKEPSNGDYSTGKTPSWTM